MSSKSPGSLSASARVRGAQAPPHPAPPKPTVFLSPWTRTGATLFWLGFLTLFLELLLIRYLAGSIWNLGYFPNTVLLSAFLGMGIGFAFHHHVSEVWSPRVFLAGLALAVGLILFVTWKHPIVPGFNVWHYNLDGDLYFSFVPFQVDDLNYVFFSLCFVLVIAVFACLSQRTAKVFRLFAPLNAYTLDILGSCAGIVTFMIVSALWLPAWSWFALFTGVFLLALPSGWKARLFTLALAAAALAVMYQQDRVFMRDPSSKNPLQTIWSPYQKIEYVEEPPPPSFAGRLRRRIFVNGLDHQEMLDRIDRTFYEIPHQARAQSGLPPYRRVLVIGAGSGNDVVAALKHGAEHLDAVEIDPVIAELGRRHNPYLAYRDPRVRVVVDDGRAFMTQADGPYDLIVFALTDSLVKLSSLTQLRLENYLFTRESVERAHALLAPGGDLVFYNFYRLPFVAEKIQRLVEHATGNPPRILVQERDFYMVCGSKTGSGAKTPLATNRPSNVPTDDWPFLYLERRGIPAVYLKAMVGVFVLVAGLLAGLHWSTRGQERFQQPGLLAIKTAFVIMGVAFLLLEAKSIIQFSLLFGATWFNNSLIFLAVLLSVLAANWTVQWLRPQKSVPLFFALLIAAALASYVIPLHALLHISNGALRFAAGAALTLSPIYFANLVFSSMFREQTVPEHIFGWNLLGATLGGVLEYLSMATGYNALSLVVAGCYTLVFALLLAARRRRTTSLLLAKKQAIGCA